MRSILIQLFIVISLLSSVSGEESKQHRLVEQFNSHTFTRGWVFGMLRVNNSDQNLDEEINFSWSMTAYAFNYWLLSRNGHIKIDEVFDKLIIKTFHNKELPVQSLDDPLRRNSKNNGAFSPYLVEITNNNYDAFVKEFRNFIMQKNPD